MKLLSWLKSESEFSKSILLLITPAVLSRAALFLLAILFSQTIYASPGWQGKWDSLRKPVENPVVYYYYEITKTAEGINWKSVKRDVPYGPNEQVRSGQADFVSRSQAVDYNNNLTFDLSMAASGKPQLVVRSHGSDVANFYFVPRFFKAGFNCNKASTAIEKAICTDKRIAMADLQINREYKKARITLKSGERKLLKLFQRAWIKQRNRCHTKGKVDMSCLALSYANRLATLQKINNPTLGSGEGVNYSYIAGLQKTRAAIHKNVPILLVVASEQQQWAVELMKHPAVYKVDKSDNKAVLTAGYSYNSVCWPDDCIINIELIISVDGSGDIKVVKSQKSKKL